MFSSLSATPPVVPDDTVRDVTLPTFKADVLEASKSALVLVEFWATWCGPCKQLMPVLEKIARESKGAIKLAKLDIDKNQPIAQQMGVQSVPSVFAFYQGRPVDGFAGALPEAQVKSWIAQLMQAAGIGGDDKAGIETALTQAAEFLATKDIATAQSIYADLLDMDPTCAPAYAGLLRCSLDAGEVAEARRMLDAAPAAMAKDKIFEPIRAALELAEQSGGADAAAIAALEQKLVQNDGDHQARFDLAIALYGAGRREEAVDHLLDIVRRSRTWNEDAARKQLVKFFEALGGADPLTISARKRLSSLLFS